MSEQSQWPLKHPTMVPLVSCPCREIGNVQTFRAALDSEESTNVLVSWLSNEEGRNLSCQPQQPDVACVRRVGASFSVLNGIRDAVRPFLESTKPSEAAEPTYEESFPSLSSTSQSTSSPNVLVARKTTQKKASTATTSPIKKNPTAPGKKEKRRAQLQPVTMNVNRQGNIAMLSSTMIVNDRKGNKSLIEEWPAIPVGKKIMSSSNGTATKGTKRRIKPAPATVWGSAAPGNLTAMSALSDSASDVPTAADFDRIKQNSAWSAKKTDDSVKNLLAPNPAMKLNGDVYPHKPEADRKRERQNLARIYSTLVLNHLVPSTALELHLLVRLLTAKESSTALPLAKDDNNTSMFHGLFTSASCCHSFAVDVLTQIKCILCNLPLDVVEGFVNCPSFSSLLTDVTNELKGVIESRKEALFLSETDEISLVGSSHPQVPLLPLPFDHDRDSRHNYKSRDEVAVYKNREESRDAFLYQLRAFQNIRGKMVNAAQAERSLDRIRVASQNVIQGLLIWNMFWFAQLFCDLLMQIGLVPMEETDKEILNIIDKDKLQKLHKRFSTKGTQTSKSTKNLVLDPSKSAGTTSPDIEAQQHFPGHQEFFFIFILSTDCYSFGIHLRNRLKFEIIRVRSSLDAAKGIEKRLSLLKLLSKFLGLLVFLPSWHHAGIVGATQYDRLSEFNPDLNISEMVERAYMERCLVITIPWVVEFLRMSQWSPTLQKSAGFRRLLALLLGVRHSIRCDSGKSSSVHKANMQLVSLYLETLFGDIIGLERTATVPAAIMESSTVPANGKPDSCPLRVSKLLLSSNPHTEELVALLSLQVQSHDKSASSSKKLTPYSVGGSIVSSTDPLGKVTVTSISPVESKRSASRGNGIDQMTSHLGGPHHDSPILAKLVEAFFHQHRDLKDICEFIVDQVLKNCSARIRDLYVVPILKDSMLRAAKGDVDSNLFNAEEQAAEASRTFLVAELGRNVPEALATLCPPTIQPKVRDIATKLSISHANRLGEAMIASLIQLESKKLSLDGARILKKQATSLGVQEQNGDSQNEVAQADDALLSLRNSLGNRTWERRPDLMLAIVKKAREERSKCTNSSGATPRGLDRALELASVPLLKWCLEEGSADSSVRWEIVKDFFGVLALFCESTISSFQKHFKTSIASFFFAVESTYQLVKLGLKGAEDTDWSIVDLLHDMTRAKLMPSTQLEAALLRSLQDHHKGRLLCLHFLSTVDRYHEASNEQTVLVFARLRDELNLQVSVNDNEANH